ncbi:MAG: hypothetical protein ACRC23_02070 [Aeromonas jandaei]
MKNLLLAFCLITSALKGEQLNDVIQRTKDGDIKVVRNVGSTTIKEFKDVKRIGETISFESSRDWNSIRVLYKENDEIHIRFINLDSSKLYCFVETYEITGSTLYETTEGKRTNYIILGAE